MVSAAALFQPVADEWIARGREGRFSCLRNTALEIRGRYFAAAASLSRLSTTTMTCFMVSVILNDVNAFIQIARDTSCG